LAISKPTAAGILMLISGIGGFIAISAGYLFGGTLRIVGGILALVSRKSKRRADGKNQPVVEETTQ